MEWDDGRVSITDSVNVPRPLSGAELRDAYADALATLTHRLVGMRGNSVVIGPLELLRFDAPKVERDSVEWPVVGGLLARHAGGTWRVRSLDGKAEAALAGYAPTLPTPIYALTQLHVHLLFTRLYLLRLRGREPAPGLRAARQDRRGAASIDVALILTVTRLLGVRRLRSTLALAAAYHVACWSTSGRTLGGVVMRQRVVALDGSRLTPMQSLFRLALIPVSWIARRPVHDELAGTDVITD